MNRIPSPQDTQSLLAQIRLLHQVDSLWERIEERIQHSTNLLKEQREEIENINTALSDVASELQECEEAVERLSVAVEPVVETASGIHGDISREVR